MRPDLVPVRGDLWSDDLHARATPLGVPLAGNFELTARCNFNCKMCYVHRDGESSGELSAEEWLELGKRGAARGMLFLLLTGGEPLLREDFREIYTGLKKLGLLLSINTNGYFLDAAMVAFLKKNPPVRVNVSLYGGGDGDYRELCGVPAFGRVAENILRTKEAGLPVRLNTVITPANARSAPAIRAFAEAHRLHIKGTSYLFPPVRISGGQWGCAPCRFEPEEAAEQLSLWRKGQPFRVREREDCPDLMGAPMNCRAGKTSFWVTWDGRMLPCGMFPGEGYGLKALGFDRAWELVRRDCAAIRLPVACSSCADRDACALCAASCLAETGGFDRPPEYICRMTKHLRAITEDK